MSTVEPTPPNESGETQCIVRWMVETSDGWLGAWDRKAFDAYVAEAVQEEREACAKVCEDAISRDSAIWIVAKSFADAIRMRANANVTGLAPKGDKP